MDTLKADLESIDLTKVNAKLLTWDEVANLIEYKLKPHGNTIDYIIASAENNLYDVYLRNRLTEEEWKLKTEN